MEFTNNFFTAVETISKNLSNAIWGLPMLVILVGGSIFYAIRSRLLPLRYIGHAIAILRGKYDNPNDPGYINHFEALTTALAATVGMGNISGVAIAVTVGGPGALFWMWISALLGMTTKFFTCSASIMFRKDNGDGTVEGGPMYMIEKGMGKNFKVLGTLFSVAGMIGVLPIFQTNQLIAISHDVFLSNFGIPENPVVNTIFATLLVVVLIFILWGGIKRIGSITSKLVPMMVVLYFVSVLWILGIHYEKIPEYFSLIISDAFQANFYKGDSILGGVLGSLIIHGVRRAAFSNEAGLGSAALAHGAAKTEQPIREGLVAMLGPFIDTIIVCTMTGLALIATGVWKEQGGEAEGIQVTLNAFEQAIPEFGGYILFLCVFFFSFSSLISYAYYGGKCFQYLSEKINKNYYIAFYLLSIYLGALASMNTVVSIIEVAFATMAIPTMISGVYLSGVVMREAEKYFDKLKH